MGDPIDIRYSFGEAQEQWNSASEGAYRSQARVCVIILTYNNWDQTELCLASLSKLDFPAFRVVIVDNGSRIPCPTRITDGFPAAELLVNPKNLGYSQGCNAGIRHARRQNPEYLWLLNNDTEVQPGSLTALVELSDSDPRLGAVGSLLLDASPERNVQAWGGGTINSLSGLSPARQGPHARLDYICGASLFLRSSALDEAGLFNPKFFLYWEDTDLCYRLRAGGWKLGMAPESIVVHKGSDSTMFQSTFYDYHFTASSIRFFRLHCRYWFLPVLVSVSGRMTMRMLRGKANNAAAVWRAFKDALADAGCPGSNPVDPPTTTKDSGGLPPLIILDPGNFTPLYDINLAGALADRGWRPSFVTSQHQFDSPPVLPGITVRNDFYRFMRLPWLKPLKTAPAPRRLAKVASYPFGLARLSRFLATLSPGILHVQWTLMPPLDRLFWRRCQKLGWQVVFTAHEPKPLTGTLPDLLTRSRAQTWSAADAVIVHGEQAARIVREAGIREDRIHVLPPGPPASRMRVSRDEARNALKIPPEERVVLFFGYIKPYKGFDILLQSLPALKKTVGRLLCLVAGECMDPAERYRTMIAKLRLEGEVRWFDGYVAEKVVPVYFAACDVVALPYLESASSGVLLSAYAFERPVVATAVGGNTELVEDGRSGILVPPGDPVALADALGKVLQNPELASAMGARGNETLRREYSWEKIADGTEQVYRILLAKKRR